MVTTQRNARIHLLACVCVVVLGLALGVSRQDWLVLALVCGLVIAAECVNTAVEALVDLVSPKRSALAKTAKDAAAASVLVCALTAVVVGMLVFLPQLPFGPFKRVHAAPVEPRAATSQRTEQAAMNGDLPRPAAWQRLSCRRGLSGRVSAGSGRLTGYGFTLVGMGRSSARSAPAGVATRNCTF